MLEREKKNVVRVFFLDVTLSQVSAMNTVDCGLDFCILGPCVSVIRLQFCSHGALKKQSVRSLIYMSNRRTKDVVAVEMFISGFFFFSLPLGSIARSDFPKEIRHYREDPKTGKYTSV